MLETFFNRTLFHCLRWQAQVKSGFVDPQEAYLLKTSAQQRLQHKVFCLTHLTCLHYQHRISMLEHWFHPTSSRAIFAQ